MSSTENKSKSKPAPVDLTADEVKMAAAGKFSTFVKGVAPVDLTADEVKMAAAGKSAEIMKRKMGLK